MNTDVHYYDGKIDDCKDIIRDYITEYNQLPQERKDTFIQILQDKLSRYQEFTGKSVAGFQILKNGYQTEFNYDPINKISADHLIYICCLIDNSDFDLLLIEQIGDIIDGQCAQGRTIRLLQLIIIFITIATV